MSSLYKFPKFKLNSSEILWFKKPKFIEEDLSKEEEEIQKIYSQFLSNQKDNEKESVKTNNLDEASPLVSEISGTLTESAEEDDEEEDIIVNDN
jgi:hypothetical protein